MPTKPTLDDLLDATRTDVHALDRLLSHCADQARWAVLHAYRDELIAEVHALEQRLADEAATREPAHLILYNGARKVAEGDVTAYVQVRLAGRAYTVSVSRSGLSVQRNDPEYGDIEAETSLPLDQLAALADGGFPYYRTGDTP